MGEPEQVGAAQLRDAERMKFFTDAVVAIAMTLLILPLLESVSDAAKDRLSTSEYLNDHGGELFAFVLSFVIIASSWVGHERLFSRVERWSGRLMVLNIAWMLSIVFLPVATAMVGTMQTDALQRVIYIGTMMTSSTLMALMALVVRRDHRLWNAEGRPGPGAVTSQIILTALFGLALLVGLLSSAIGFYAMFLLFLTGPLQGAAQRRWPG